MSLTTKLIVGSICAFFCIGVLLIIILIPTSIADIAQTEIAIEYGRLDREITTDRVFTEGRYYNSLLHTFFRFNRTLQTLDLSGEVQIECLSSEGLDMRLDITTQYQINPDNLVDIFREYGLEENYVPYLNSITRDGIKDVCSNFTGQDFFLRRGEIETAITDALVIVYQESNSYSTSQLVQLRNVMHPSTYDQANREIQQIEQELDRLARERVEFLTRATTELLAAEENAEILRIQSEAEAGAIIVEADQLALAETELWTRRAQGLQSIRNGLNDTSDQAILDYLRYDAIIQQTQPIISI